MHKEISDFAVFTGDVNEARNKILAPFENNPQVSAFVTALLDDSPFDKGLSGTKLTFYSILYHDATEMASIGLSALLDKKGTRTEFFLFVERLKSVLQNLDRAMGLSIEGQAWQFPEKTAVVLREIAKTLRSGQHA